MPYVSKGTKNSDALAGWDGTAVLHPLFDPGAFFCPMLLFRMAFWVEGPEAVEPSEHALLTQAMFPCSFLVFSILIYIIGLRILPI